MTNLADRLCATAEASSILITQRVAKSLDPKVDVDVKDALNLVLKGFARRVMTYRIVGPGPQAEVH